MGQRVYVIKARRILLLILLEVVVVRGIQRKAGVIDGREVAAWESWW